MTTVAVDKKRLRPGPVMLVWVVMLIAIVAFKLTASGKGISKTTRLELASTRLSLRNFGNTDTFPLLDRGSYGAVAFVRTTCAACEEGAPKILKALALGAGDRSIVVFLDSDSLAIQEYAKRAGIPDRMIAVPVDGVRVREFGIRFVPTVILSREDNVWGWIGTPSWPQVLAARIRLRWTP